MNIKIRLIDEEKELLKDFNKLDEKDQAFIMKLLEVFSDDNTEEINNELLS